MQKLAGQTACSRRLIRAWTAVPQAPPDAILGLSTAFKLDPSPNKVSLGVGAYRTDKGEPFVLESVRIAEKLTAADHLDHEYCDISGNTDFVEKALVFAYGEDSADLASRRVAGVQTLSGTGALRLGAEFLSKFGPSKTIFLPSPTWGNHFNIMKFGGLNPHYYRYYNRATKGFDFDGFKEDVWKAPSKSIFLLHACAHNPTGFDPSTEQWDELSLLFLAKEHVVFFDNAYQGFASGDSEQDAYSIRKFVSDGHDILLAQSFAKNFGLYGDRIGALSIVASHAEEAERLTSQLKVIVRAMYSSPPLQGARLVSRILGDERLRTMWKHECKFMAQRIKQMRVALRGRLEEEFDSAQDFGFITAQIGMFCYTGLTKTQVHALKTEHHIYCTDDGRLSVAGLNTTNVDFVGRALAEVMKKVA